MSNPQAGDEFFLLGGLRTEGSDMGIRTKASHKNEWTTKSALWKSVPKNYLFYVCSRDHLFSKECWFRLQGCRTCAVSNSVSFCTLVQRESWLDTHQKCYQTVIFSCPSYFAFFYEPWRVLKVSHRASEWCLRRALVDWRRSTRSKPTLKVVMRNFSQLFGIIWRAGTGPTNHTLQDSKRRSLAKFHP